MDLGLVTKIVILLTAVVGLYKAATFKPLPGSLERKTDGGAGRFPIAISAFFELVGVFLFMLAFPAFIWAFSWISNNIVSRPASAQMTQARQIVLSKKSTPAEAAYVAATNIPYSDAEAKALTKVVGIALDENDFRTAVIAAMAIPYADKERDQLLRIVDAAQRAKREEK